MRRSLSAMTLAALLLTLGGCREEEKLPPEEVLRRASAVNQLLRSARFQMEGTYRDGTGSERAFALTDGILQDGGRFARFTLETSVAGTGGIAPAANDVFYVFPCDLYVKLAAAPAGNSGAWTRMTCDAQSVVPDIAPDPLLLKLQTEAVTVLKDRGWAQEAGRRYYQYDIALRPSALRSLLPSWPPEGDDWTESLLNNEEFTGELRVDAMTFRLRRLSWGMTSTDGNAASPSLRFSLLLWDHDAAPPVRPPVNAGSALRMPSGSSSLLFGW